MFICQSLLWKMSNKEEHLFASATYSFRSSEKLQPNPSTSGIRKKGFQTGLNPSTCLQKLIMGTQATKTLVLIYTAGLADENEHPFPLIRVKRQQRAVKGTERWTKKKKQIPNSCFSIISNILAQEGRKNKTTATNWKYKMIGYTKERKRKL